MIGKVYPSGEEWVSLAQEYVSSFTDLPELEERWSDFKEHHRILQVFPETVEQLMKLSFEELTDVYRRYLGLSHENQQEETELASIKSYLQEMVFNYDRVKRGRGLKTHQALISSFFKDRMEKFNIHTCYYCDMAYINPYMTGEGVKSQFDLDHALSKDSCPLVALSLHNFVPSCSVCNQRLKRKRGLSDTLDGIKKVAPCSENFDADRHIYFKVEELEPCTSGYLKNSDKYKIKVKAKGIYGSYSKLFRLEERYEYHKSEALRWLDLKRKYPDSNLKKIAILLHKTTDEVREDIFGIEFSKTHHRCFDKMKQDIL